MNENDKVHSATISSNDYTGQAGCFVENEMELLRQMRAVLRLMMQEMEDPKGGGEAGGRV